MQNVLGVNSVQHPVVSFKKQNPYNPQAGLPGSRTAYDVQQMQREKNKNNTKQNLSLLFNGVLAAAFATIAITGLLTFLGKGKGPLSGGSAKLPNEFNISNLKFRKLKNDASIADLKTTNTLQEQVKKFFMDMAESSNYEPKYIKRAGLTYKSFPNAGLLLGPSGVGKTESVKMFAKDQDAEFLIIKLGDFANSFVDGTATNMTKMFEELKVLFENNPDKKYVLLFDEADGIAKKLGDISGDRDYLNKNRQAFLTGLDTIMPCRNVNIFAATNVTLKEMDEAVISRFGQNVEFELPNKIQLLEGLKFHLKDCEGIPEKFFENNIELNKFIENMVRHKYSFRDLQKVSSHAQALYCKDMNDHKKELDFSIKYLQEALERKGKTSAEAANEALDQNQQYSVDFVEILKKLLNFNA